MQQSLLSLLSAAAVAAPAFALPQGAHQKFGEHHGGCGGGQSSRAAVIASSAYPTGVFPSSAASASKVVAVPTSTSETVPSSSDVASTEKAAALTSSTSKTVALSTTTTSQAVAVPTSSTSKVVVVPTTTAKVVSSVTTKTAASSKTSTTAAAATSSAVVTESTETLTASYCGAPNAYQILTGTPWIVYSMNYNYQDISGSCCTGYYSTSGSDDDQTVHWNSIWDIDESVSTDVVKGYSFIGLTQNLETTLESISSIPSTYTWSISNTTAYKGNVVYDFMTSDTKGDSTSTAAQELMLWLHWEGGQVPIGWADGAVATIDDLFGKDGWKLYQGKNDDTGITVSSLLAPEDDMFDGTFTGDIKDWLTAISEQGVFTTSTYVNVGNAGMEPYWGTVTFDNTLSLRIDL